MYAEITAATQSVKILYDLLKSARELKNFNEVVAALSEVNAKLMDAQAAALLAQEKQSSLANRIGDLEKEIMDLKNWEREAQRYELFEIAPRLFTYKLKPGVQPPEPIHMLCANCYAKRQKAILQLYNENDFGTFYSCHNCKSEISIRRDPGNATGGYNPFTYGFEPR
jgi:hypothetical protein